MILRGKELKGWWAGFSGKTSAIEMPISWPFPGFLQIDSAYLADVNADGYDDVVGHCISPESFWVALTKAPNGVRGVMIELNDAARPGGANSVLSDEAGRFQFSIPKNTYLELKPTKPGFRFQPETIRVAGEHVERRTINFVAVPELSSEAIVGRSIRLDGDFPGPYTCTGYHPLVSSAIPEQTAGDGSFPEAERGDHWRMEMGACPDGYAFFNVQVPDPSSTDPVRRSYRGNCCRLPFPDILSSHVISVDETCPEGSVVTGAIPFDQASGKPSKLRCTALNLDRYGLGSPTAGKSWGVALGLGGEEEMVPKSAIPSAIRFGAGRLGFDKWETQGCLGFPWGSLLTSGRGDRCRDFRFQQLVSKGQPGDPPAGTPIAMFPACRAMESTFDPAGGCLP